MELKESKKFIKFYPKQYAQGRLEEIGWQWRSADDYMIRAPLCCNDKKSKTYPKLAMNRKQFALDDNDASEVDKGNSQKL